MELVGDDAVVVKRVSGGLAAIEAVRREGERLRQATHPGVVSVIRSAPWREGWELVLAHGGRSLATIDQPSTAEAAAIVAGIASTVADLHEIGVTHGRIDPSHVLISDTGSPRLCGFGDGAIATTPEDDVAAIGALLEHLLGADADEEPIPERRWGGGRRRWRGWERRALLTLVDQATNDDPALRPTARRLAAGIVAAVPATERAEPRHLKEDDDPIERLRPPSDPTPSASPRRRRPVALALVGVLLGLAVAHRLQASGGAVSAPPPAPGSTDVRVAAPITGSVIVEDGRRYRVGQEGDHLLVADWSCDGRPTPAAFRPSTDEVFVFHHWAGTGPLTVRPTATVAGGVEMVSSEGADGCPKLLVRTVEGDDVPIPLGDLR